MELANQVFEWASNHPTAGMFFTLAVLNALPQRWVNYITTVLHRAVEFGREVEKNLNREDPPHA